MWFLLPVNEVEPREDAVNLRPERVKYIELLRKVRLPAEARHLMVAP